MERFLELGDTRDAFRCRLEGVESDEVAARLIQCRQEGRKGCNRCARRICLLLVVHMSLLELNRATSVFRCSCSMGSPVRGRVRTGTLMTRSSSSVKAGECGQSTAR